MGLGVQNFLTDFIRFHEKKQSSKTSEAIAYSDDNVIFQDSEKDDFLAQEYDIKTLIKENFDEFLQYCKEFGYSDTDLSDKSLDEILSMQFVDGKLTDSKDNKENELKGLDDLIDEARDELEAEDDDTDLTDVESSLDDIENADISEDEIYFDDSDEMDVSDDKTATDDTDNTIDETVSPIETMLKVQDSSVADILKNKVNIQGKIDLTKDDIDNYKSVYRLLKDSYKDVDISKIIDEDGDGKISDEEKKKFNSYVKESNEKYDLDVLKDICKSIKDNEFDIEDYKNYKIKDEKSDKEDTEETKETQETPSSQGASSSGSSGGGGGSYSGGSSKELQKYDANGNAILENMNTDELKQELNKANSSYKEKQNELKEAYTSTNDKVDKAKKEADDKFKEYNEAIKESDEANSELADKIADKKQEIDEKETAIDEKDAEIAIQEANVSVCENNCQNAQNTITELNTRLQELQGKNEKGKLDDKISALQEEIAAAEQAKTAADEALIKAKEDLEAKKEEKNTLEKELEQAKAELEELENQVPDDGEDGPVHKAKEAWENAKKAYEEEKANFKTEREKNIATAKSNLNDSKDYVNKVQNALSEAQNKDKLKNYCASTLPEGLFKGSLAGKEDLVCEAADKYGLDPVLVASIIALESGWGTSNLAAHNNFMGYRAGGDAGTSPNGFGYFSSPEAGLDATVGNLARYTRFSEVKEVSIDYINQIGSHYCPGGTWPGKIATIYNQILGKM